MISSWLVVTDDSKLNILMFKDILLRWLILAEKIKTVYCESEWINLYLICNCSLKLHVNEFKIVCHKVYFTVLHQSFFHVCLPRLEIQYKHLLTLWRTRHWNLKQALSKEQVFTNVKVIKSTSPEKVHQHISYTCSRMVFLVGERGWGSGLGM